MKNEDSAVSLENKYLNTRHQSRNVRLSDPNIHRRRRRRSAHTLSVVIIQPGRIYGGRRLSRCVLTSAVSRLQASQILVIKDDICHARNIRVASGVRCSRARLLIKKKNI